MKKFLKRDSTTPLESFAFCKEKLICLTKFYPSKFSYMELMGLQSQLETFIRDVRFDNQFLKLKRIVDLSQMLVKTKNYIVYPMVYLLVKLVLFCLWQPQQLKDASPQ